MWLVTRESLAVVGLALCSAGAALAIVEAITRGSEGGAERVPALTAYFVAWGGGMTVAFGGALRALPRDREQGLLSLARARGADSISYLRGRVGGLVVVLAIATGVPALLAGIASTSVARPVGVALRASLGAVAYAIAFAVTVGPVAMATLGARTRTGGYLALVGVLVLPELLSPWTGELLPAGWRELASIPAALDALGSGVASADRDWLSMARATAALAAVVAASLVVVAARLPRSRTRAGA
jgi:hypothetical protein